MFVFEEKITLGEFVHLMRFRKDLSQKKLADMSGISRATLIAMEKDKDVRIETIIAVADALGFTASVKLVGIKDE